MLAARLLGGDPEEQVQDLQRQIERGVTESLPVQPAAPVYLVYLTTWVDDRGNLQLRDDVYGRDVQLRDCFTFAGND